MEGLSRFSNLGSPVPASTHPPEVTHSPGCLVGPPLMPHSLCTSCCSGGRSGFGYSGFASTMCLFLSCGPPIKTERGPVCCNFELTHLPEGGLERRLKIGVGNLCVLFTEEWAVGLWGPGQVGGRCQSESLSGLVSVSVNFLPPFRPRRCPHPSPHNNGVNL